MKKLLLTIALITCARSARAQNQNYAPATPPPVPAQNVIQVNRSSNTCGGMTINTYPTSVVGSTQSAVGVGTFTAVGYAWVYVENEDAAANIFCDELYYVTTSGNTRGKKITPNNWVQWILKPGEPWYCLTDGAAAINAQVCKGK